MSSRAAQCCCALALALTVVDTPPARAEADIPMELKRELDRHFPGWELPRLGPEIKRCNPKAAVVTHGDFDGDGRPDIALEIVQANELVIATRLGTGHWQVLLRNSHPPGKDIERGLDVLPKGERIAAGPMYAQDALVILDCSEAATVTYFSVRAGKWHSDVEVTE